MIPQHVIPWPSGEKKIKYAAGIVSLDEHNALQIQSSCHICIEKQAGENSDKIAANPESTNVLPDALVMEEDVKKLTTLFCFLAKFEFEIAWRRN